MSVSWSQALAWRLRQHLLDPIGTESVAGVVGRLGAVQTQVPASAELAIRLRQQRSRTGEVDKALAAGLIIKNWAMRGAMQLMTPENAGVYLALRAATRMWELPSWQSFYNMTPSDWQGFRAAAHDALAHGPMTWQELATTITEPAKFRHLRPMFPDHWVTLLKPLAWQGDLVFGPTRDEGPTFQRLDDNPHWQGLPELDDAGTRAVEHYFRAYGPATTDHLQHWIGSGLGVGGKRLLSWIAGLGDRLTPVEIEGERAYILSQDLQGLTAMRPSTVMRLLPAFDPWVLGPGTADSRIVPPARRSLLSRAGAIVIIGGVVSGTWTLKNDQVAVAWFGEIGSPSHQQLADEIARLGTILGQDLELTTQSV